MEFRILGPLEALDDEGRPIPLTQRKPRAVLAMLLLHAGEVVPSGRLIDAVWGENPPPKAEASLQNAVSRLRHAIGRESITSREGGYLLNVEPGQIDLARFRRRVADAKTEEPAVRARMLREALGLSRGEPLAEFTDEPFAAEHGPGLEAMRAAAVEELMDVELELGGAAELVADLEAEIGRTPFNERLRAQLMLALYRAGRQAEALEVYRATRARLLDERGLEPGEELKQLEQAILRHDPALAAPRIARRPSFEAGRKSVTTLVAEITVEAGDPERLRRTHERFAEDVRIAIERRGGRVHELGGDTITALFGVPTAREDDAFRAVRAAEDVRAVVEGVELRVAIDTGEAFVRGDSVTGEAAGNARRLIETAGPGEVVVGAATLALVRDAVTAERVEGARTRGRAVDAFRVVAFDEGGTPVARNLDAPLVGRRHELARLDDELKHAFSERRCRLVTLVGEAGIGKSRLARELVDRAGDEAEVLVGRCVSYGGGATYLPLADVVRRAVPDAAEEAIAGRLEADDERALVAERLAALVGITDTVVASGDAFWAVRRFLEALARERPLIVFFDDVHWAEPTFLDLVEHLREWIEDAPVLLVCAARPELLEMRPAWGASAIVLGRLEANEVNTLVDQLGDGLGDDERARVIEQAEGNPLYVEQLVAAIAESDEELPASIEALLAARLDRLEPAERELLQRASVVGREFDAETLAGLANENPSRVRGSLGRLERRGLVRSRGHAFRFHHVLVREAAYASTPKETRANLHARVADLVTGDELIGLHLERAHGYGAELGSEDVRLAERAGEHLARAGMRAFARGDAPAANNLLERAIALLPKRDPTAIELQCELGIVRWIAGRHDAAAILHDAHVAAVGIADRRLELRAQLELAFVGLHGGGDARRALQVARDAIPTFQEFDDARALGRAWYLVATIEASFLCQNGDSVRAIEEAITHYRRSDFPPSVCIAHLASALHYGPTPVTKAIARCRELLESGEAGRNGDAVVRMWLAALEAKQGRFGAARSLLDDAGEAFRQLGQGGSAAGLEAVRGAVELLASDGEAAVRHLTAACRAYEELGLTANLATAGANLAEVLHAQGRLAEATEWLDRAELAAKPSDISAQFWWRSARAKILASRGDLLGAERLGREAVELVDSTDALNEQASVRVSLAFVLDLGGRHAEATAVRTEALKLLEAKENIVAAQAVRAALDRVPA